MHSFLHRSFFGISSLYLFLQLLQQEAIACYLKPLLIPVLLLMVIQSHFATKKPLVIALFFSWLGDVILIFSEKSEWYFILGLLFFLTAHLTYIYLFSQQKSKINTLKKPLFALGIFFILIYLLVLLNHLLPQFGALKIPVAVYAITISIMAIMALKGFLTWKKPMNIMVFCGALSFVSSDSLLAINKFSSPLSLASFWIMATYLLAQYCIVIGILKMNQTTFD